MDCEAGNSWYVCWNESLTYHFNVFCLSLLVGEDLEVSWFSVQKKPGEDTIDYVVAWVRPNLLQSPWSPRCGWKGKIATESFWVFLSLFRWRGWRVEVHFFRGCPLSCEPFLAHPLAADRYISNHFYTFLSQGKHALQTLPTQNEIDAGSCWFNTTSEQVTWIETWHHEPIANAFWSLFLFHW